MGLGLTVGEYAVEIVEILDSEFLGLVWNRSQIVHRHLIFNQNSLSNIISQSTSRIIHIPDNWTSIAAETVKLIDSWLKSTSWASISNIDFFIITYLESVKIYSQKLQLNFTMSRSFKPESDDLRYYISIDSQFINLMSLQPSVIIFIRHFYLQIKKARATTLNMIGLDIIAFAL